jgi:hypothetical protein
MAKRILIQPGDRFGNLTVIQEVEPFKDEKGRSRRLILCVCDCGKKVEIQPSALNTGHQKSCGCNKYKFAAYGLIDESGKKYGRLTVIKRVVYKEKKAYKWECLCECGKKTLVSGTNLRTAVTQSCGCLLKEAITKHGLYRTKAYVNVNNHLRREKIRSVGRAESAQISRTAMESSKECVYCGSQENLSLDHFIPLSRGGSHNLDNLVVACLHCNKKKSTIDAIKWYEKQPFFEATRLQKILSYLASAKAE